MRTSSSCRIGYAGGTSIYRLLEKTHSHMSANRHFSDIEAMMTKVCCWGQSRPVVYPSVKLPSCRSHSTGNCFIKSSSSRLAGCRASMNPDKQLHDAPVADQVLSEKTLMDPNGIMVLKGLSLPPRE